MNLFVDIFIKAVLIYAGWYGFNALFWMALQ